YPDRTGGGSGEDRHHQRGLDHPQLYARRRRRDGGRPARSDRAGERDVAGVRERRLPLPVPSVDDRNAGRRLTYGRRPVAQSENDSPQAHSCVARGFRIFKPPPSSASSNSSVEPSTIGALIGSIRTRTPCRSTTRSASSGPSTNESS